MSSKYVGIEDARKQLGPLVTAVQQGTDVVLTRNGKPAARIVRYQEDAMDIADLTRYLGEPDHQQEAVFAWTGETDRDKRWTEAEADELVEIWKADTSGAETR